MFCALLPYEGFFIKKKSQPKQMCCVVKFKLIVKRQLSLSIQSFLITDDSWPVFGVLDVMYFLG